MLHARFDAFQEGSAFGFGAVELPAGGVSGGGLGSVSREDVTAGFLGADAFHKARLDERPEEVEGALLGDGQRVPDFARGETVAVTEQLEQLLLFGAQDQLLLFRLRGEFLYAGPDTFQGEQEAFGAVVEPVGQIVALLAHGL